MLTSIMTDQTTAPQFRKLFSRHLTSFVHRTTKALDVSLEPEVVSKMVNRANVKNVAAGGFWRRRESSGLLHRTSPLGGRIPGDGLHEIIPIGKRIELAG